MFENENIAYKEISNFLEIENILKDMLDTDGFISIDKNRIKKVIDNSVQLDKLYSGVPIYEKAKNFKSWASDFLKKSNVKEGLEKFAEFWNSTSHTNFDWVGPIETKL